MKKLFLLLFLSIITSSFVRAQDYKTMESELEDLSKLIQDIETMESTTSTETPKPTEVVQEVVEVKTPEVKPEIKEEVVLEKVEEPSLTKKEEIVMEEYEPVFEEVKDVKTIEKEEKVEIIKKEEKQKKDLDEVKAYHYSYMPPSKEKGFNEEGRYISYPGNFYFTILGEYADYRNGPSKAGFLIDVGWQFSVIKYLQLAVESSLGYRDSYEADEEQVMAGVKGVIRVPVLPWLITSLSSGVEFINTQPSAYWIYPNLVYGFGLLFDVGRIATNSQTMLFNYRTWGISRISFVISINGSNTFSSDPYAKNALFVRSGFCIEI